MKNEVKFPKENGLEIARKSLKDILNKKPSEELIRIINENNSIIESEENIEDLDRVAKPNDLSI